MQKAQVSVTGIKPGIAKTILCAAGLKYLMHTQKCFAHATSVDSSTIKENSVLLFFKSSASSSSSTGAIIFF